MPKQKIIPVIKWKGTEKQCYYESKLFGENTKFYSSFIKNDNDYNVGDFAFFNATADQKYRQICKFLCFFEDRGEKSAIVIPYQFASFFMRSFSHLNIEFDEYNEVVSDVKEIRISLQDVIKNVKLL
ncbi:hypothetical protein HHI36_001150 [Cryptolaemus montrouzieri]|uniref:Uncharacterized protein n=1 Tax=Cryptolaemus montrouzieri TaxID=559131 RepID=A0ABD2P6U1_9CUCU